MKKYIKAAQALESRQQIAVCRVMATVLYGIRSLYVGLAVKAMSESSTGNASVSESDSVASGGGEARFRHCLNNWEGKDSHYCNIFGSREARPLEPDSTTLHRVSRASGATCTKLGRFGLLQALIELPFILSFSG